MSCRAWDQCWRGLLPIWLCLLVFAFPLVPPAEADDTGEKLLIGIEPEHNIFDQVARYRHLARYLSEQLGVQVNLTIVSRYGEVLNRFKTLGLDGAFLTPYTAMTGIRDLHLEPVANPVNLRRETTSRGYLFVRKDSGIRSVKDMQGITAVFVDPATMEGYLYPLAYLKEHGIENIGDLFGRYYFSGSHESAILAVLDGRADIGAAKDTVFNKLVANDPSIEQELEILARSSAFPETTLCIRDEIDPMLKKRLSESLLKMDKTAGGRKALHQFKALRFERADKADFDKIAAMAREAKSTIVELKR